MPQPVSPTEMAIRSSPTDVVTVSVPPTATPGDYTGSLTTVRVGGKHLASIPVALTVAPWRVLDTTDYVTFVELVQSPESVALWYDVPLCCWCQYSIRVDDVRGNKLKLLVLW